MYDTFTVYNQIESALSISSINIPSEKNSSFQNSSSQLPNSAYLHPSQLWALVDEMSGRVEKAISLRARTQKDIDIADSLNHHDNLVSEESELDDSECGYSDSSTDNNENNKHINQVSPSAPENGNVDPISVSETITPQTLQTGKILDEKDFFDKQEMRRWVREAESKRERSRIMKKTTNNNRNKNDESMSDSVHSDSEIDDYDVLREYETTDLGETAKYEDFFGEGEGHQFLEIEKTGKIKTVAKTRKTGNRKEQKKNCLIQDQESTFDINEDAEENELAGALTQYAEEMSIDLSDDNNEDETLNNDSCDDEAEDFLVSDGESDNSLDQKYPKHSQAKRDLSESISSDNNDFNISVPTLTALEKRIKILQEEVTLLEGKQVENKKWTMLGEVGASARPFNSILEQNIELPFCGNKSDPKGYSKENTEAIDWGSDSDAEPENLKHDSKVTNDEKEQLIISRIQNMLFDDIKERSGLLLNNKESLTPLDKSSAMKFEKSKTGLAEDYAEEYEERILGAKSASQKKNEHKKEELRDLFNKLIYRLDCLCNQTFVPKPRSSDKTKMNEKPAYILEEAIPLALVHIEDVKAVDTKEHRKQHLKVMTTEFTPKQKKALRRRIKTRYQKINVNSVRTAKPSEAKSIAQSRTRNSCK